MHSHIPGSLKASSTIPHFNILKTFIGLNIELPVEAGQAFVQAPQEMHRLIFVGNSKYLVNPSSSFNLSLGEYMSILPVSL